MPLLPLTETATLYHKNGFDRFGQVVRTAGVAIRIAVIDFKNAASKGPLRTNQSASQGRDEQEIGTAKILVQFALPIAVDDEIYIYGVTMWVASVRPRRDVFGAAAHQEVMLST